MLEANKKKLKIGAFISTPIMVLGIILLIIGLFVDFIWQIFGMAIILWGILLFFIYLSKTWIKEVRDKDEHIMELDIDDALSYDMNKVIKKLQQD